MASGWVKNGRAGEVIGGGYFVFRRGDDTGRIRPSPHFPFEHATLDAAMDEARRLSEKVPGKRFAVLSVIHEYEVAIPDAALAVEPVVEPA